MTANFKETDYLIVDRDSTNYKATYGDLVDSLEEDLDIGPSASIIPPTITAPPDGSGIGGDVTYFPRTSAVTNVDTIAGGWVLESAVPTTPAPLGLAYVGGTFAVVGNRTGEIVVNISTNGGTSWTAPSTSNMNQSQWATVTGATAPDGKNWFWALAGGGSNTVRCAHSNDSAGATLGAAWTTGNMPTEYITAGRVTWKRVIFGSTNFIAAGDKCLAYNVAGQTTWTRASGVTGTAEADKSWTGVAYGNGITVACSSQDGTIRSLDEGITYTDFDENAPPGYAIAYGAGKFVLIGRQGAYYSADGTPGSWVLGNLVLENNPYMSGNSFTYADGKFVVLCQSGSMEGGNSAAYSIDGINWTGTDASAPINTKEYKAVAYGDNKFLAITGPATGYEVISNPNGTDGSTTLTLTDSKTYNNADGADMGTPISETFSSGQTVTGVKDGSADATGTLLSSPSGNTMTIKPNVGFDFTAETPASENQWKGVCYGNGKYVAVAQTGSNRAMYSTDAELWVGVTANPDSDSWQDVTYGGNKFVAVANAGSKRAMYSEDGITWTPSTTIESNDYEGVVYGKDKFVAVAYEARVSYSSDGVNWSTASAPISACYGVTYGNNRFVAVANADAMYSDNGSIWTKTSVPANNRWADVAYGGGKFVAVAANGTNYPVMYSEDGITWVGAVAEGYWASVTYADGTFVAISNSNSDNLMTSTDGINWTVQSVPTGNWQEITYGDNRVVAVSSSGTNQVMWSPPAGSAFVEGMTIVNDTEATKTGPGADELEFVGSTPQDDPNGSVSDWGNATWQVSTDENFTSPMVGTKLITNAYIPQTLTKDERGAIVLAGDTQYWARLKYAATSPATASTYSPTVTFKTAATSALFSDTTPITFFDPEAFQPLSEQQVERRFGVDPETVDASKLPVNRLTNEPQGVTTTFVQEGDKYRPIEDQTETVNKLNEEVTAAQEKVEDLTRLLSARITALENGTNFTDQPT